MLETIFVLIVIFLLIAPRATLAFILGVWTVSRIYKAVQLWSRQPNEGFALLKIRAASMTCNFILSLALAFVLASFVNALILGNKYLFLFNFIFCFFISLRWFDYSQFLFRLWVMKAYGLKKPEDPDHSFVICEGKKSNYEFGAAFAPVFLDAGFLNIEKNKFDSKGRWENIVLSPLICRR